MTRFFNFGFKSSLVGLYAAVSTFLCGSSVLAANDKRHKLKRIGIFRNWFSILFFNPILIVSISSESAPLITLVYGLFSVCMCLKYKSRVFKNIPLLLSLGSGVFTFPSLLRVININLSSVGEIRDQIAEMVQNENSQLLYNEDTITRIGNIGKMDFRKYIGWLFQIPSIVWPNVNYVGNNITYSTINNVSLQLDVISSKKYENKIKPVFFFIHGGAWCLGSRKFSSIPLLYELADNGWLVVTISYRFVQTTLYPENLRDCKRALQWVKKNITKYNGNKDHIIIGGESAGSQLSLLLSLTSKDEELNNGIDGDLTVQGCVDLYGVHNIVKTYNFLKSNFLLHKGMEYIFSNNENKQLLASPTFRIETNNLLPPTIIIHGTCDNIIPIEDSIEFSKLLDNKGIDNYLLSIPNGKHCFNYFMSPRSYACGEAISLFLDLQYHKEDKIQTKI